MKRLEIVNKSSQKGSQLIHRGYLFTKGGWLFRSPSHIKISHILLQKMFQGYGIGYLIPNHTWILEVWSLLLWKFGLGSYSRFKIHWCLAPQFAVFIVLHIKKKPRAVECDDHTIIQARCFDSQNRGLQHQRAMDLWSGITSKTKLPQQKWPYLQKI